MTTLEKVGWSLAWNIARDCRRPERRLEAIRTGQAFQDIWRTAEPDEKRLLRAGALLATESVRDIYRKPIPVDT